MKMVKPAQTTDETVETYLHAFAISALDGVSVQFHAPAALLPGKKPQLHTI